MSFEILLLGFCGGVIRGLVGFIKHQFSYKHVEFNVLYFFTIMFLSGMIGMIIAFAFNKDAVFSLIVGYAGGDFIENVYKMIIRKPFIYPIK